MSIKPLLARLIVAWALMGGVLLLGVVAATAVNVAGFAGDVVARLWDANVPGLPGYEDAVTMLVGVAALAMFPYCQMRGGHASVDVLMQAAPGWANRLVTWLSALLAAALALSMAVMLTLGTIETRSDGTETAVLGWPVWVFMPAAVVSCALWAVAALIELVDGPEAPGGA